MTSGLENATGSKVIVLIVVITILLGITYCLVYLRMTPFRFLSVFVSQMLQEREHRQQDDSEPDTVVPESSGSEDVYTLNGKYVGDILNPYIFGIGNLDDLKGKQFHNGGSAYDMAQLLDDVLLAAEQSHGQDSVNTYYGFRIDYHRNSHYVAILGPKEIGDLIVRDYTFSHFVRSRGADYKELLDDADFDYR